MTHSNLALILATHDATNSPCRNGPLGLLYAPSEPVGDTLNPWGAGVSPARGPMRSTDSRPVPSCLGTAPEPWGIEIGRPRRLTSCSPCLIACSEKGWTVFRQVGETHQFSLCRWVSPTRQRSDRPSGTDSEKSIAVRGRGCFGSSNSEPPSSTALLSPMRTLFTLGVGRLLGSGTRARAAWAT
jgi:hypothetical protein